MYYFSMFESPVGLLMMNSNGQDLVGLWIEGQKYQGESIPEIALEKDNLVVFDETKSWLKNYFAGKRPLPCELPLAPIGGEFRQGVWEIILSIPYGSVMTYGEIAKMMARKYNKERYSAQAIGGAVGHNPISIIIPCHRVVGSNGSLTGYAGGIATKIWLLELENVDMTRLFVPKKGTAL
jgi:methylated-DNA-[protein]-cysteine S-methyltransferase